MKKAQSHEGSIKYTVGEVVAESTRFKADSGITELSGPSPGHRT